MDFNFLYKKTWVRIVLMLALLYIFLTSINLMGASFKAYKEVAENLLKTASNPFIGLMIGLLATSIVQSSSTTTSMVVGMVGGGILNLEVAIPIIMGANIGTSVTNTIVSLGNIGRPEEFRRAFAVSTVHDFFNILSVIVVFPLQIYFGLLTTLSFMVTDWFQSFGGMETTDFVKVILEPSVHFFKWLALSEPILMLIFSLVLLFITLKYLSSILKSIFFEKFENAFDTIVFKNSFISFIVGLILTLLIQSSSITTSLIVPLAAAGLLTIKQVYPYTLGANIGTTITAVMASIATGNMLAIAVAFAHTWFNIIGTCIFYPLRFIPIYLANTLANLALKNKLYPIIYILIVFFAIPLTFIFLTN